MAVDDARDDCVAASVDDPGRWATKGERLAFGADVLHAAVLDGERGGHWAGIIDRVDAGVGDDEVRGGRRGALSLGHRGAERGEGRGEGSTHEIGVGAGTDATIP